MPAEEVVTLLREVLAAHGLDPAAVAELATVDVKAAEPGLLAAAAWLGVPLRAHPAAVLAAVPVAEPSSRSLRSVGTPSVAEAAALCSAGPGARLLVGKVKSAPVGRLPGATCAVAYRPGPAAHPSAPAQDHEEKR
ncbi:cobalamin biosynthesis protein [Streptomyces sp. 549]|uniref:cobalamin biosynthesis protein n=1 Tax=Streptomyces sp. 549 TaxID=3049076 RepID=UPI0024C21FCE|nr:cobalamin biosynthesis protein [Streptomyces sp. 549]MDK1474237.1 cobalamin biosynthesis protein [Streptomyces sp. 549]